MEYNTMPTKPQDPIDYRTLCALAKHHSTGIASDIFQDLCFTALHVPQKIPLTPEQVSTARKMQGLCDAKIKALKECRLHYFRCRTMLHKAYYHRCLLEQMIDGEAATDVEWFELLVHYYLPRADEQ